jgi:hypothetical protein
MSHLRHIDFFENDIASMKSSAQMLYFPFIDIHRKLFGLSLNYPFTLSIDLESTFVKDFLFQKLVSLLVVRNVLVENSGG